MGIDDHANQPVDLVIANESRSNRSLMLSRTKSLYTVARILLALSVATAFAAEAAGQGTAQKRANPGSDAGKRVFASTCAGCHGLDGKGSERAPNIADRPAIQQLSDTQLSGIIENGVPGTGMPPFHSLESSQVRAVVAYLRTLQGEKKTSARLPGDPEHGKAIFFGQARCSNCHMVAGEGGFIASDLSEYAAVHPAEQIRSALTQPNTSPSSQIRLATATMRSGEKFVGRVRNEDNFSLQLQTLDGVFHLISKSDLEGLAYDSQALMPGDYGSTLSAAELNDVISYLMSVVHGKVATKARDDKEFR